MTVCYFTDHYAHSPCFCVYICTLCCFLSMYDVLLNWINNGLICIYLAVIFSNYRDNDVTVIEMLCKMVIYLCFSLSFFICMCMCILHFVCVCGFIDNTVVYAYLSMMYCVCAFKSSCKCCSFCCYCSCCCFCCCCCCCCCYCCHCRRHCCCCCGWYRWCLMTSVHWLLYQN